MGDLHRENVRTKSPVISASHTKTIMVCGLGPDSDAVGYAKRSLGGLCVSASIVVLSSDRRFNSVGYAHCGRCKVRRLCGRAPHLGRLRRLCGRAPIWE